MAVVAYLTMTSLADVTNALTIWSAEADSGAPVTDSTLTLLAATGDLTGHRRALDLNARWRNALRAGDREAMARVLADAAAFAEADVMHGIRESF